MVSDNFPYLLWNIFIKILAYSIAHRVDGILLFPKDDIIKSKDYEIQKEEINEMIHVRDVNLDYEGDFENYINSIARELQAKIDLWLNKKELSLFRIMICKICGINETDKPDDICDDCKFSMVSTDKIPPDMTF